MFGMSEFFGESHDVYIVDMREPRPQLREGIPRTAGAHAQCLPTAFTALRWSNNRKNELDQEEC